MLASGSRSRVKPSFNDICRIIAGAITRIVQTVHDTLSYLAADPRAATMIEYALIAGAVIICCASLVALIGATAAGLFSSAVASFP